MADTEGSDLFVVFISNDKKQVSSTLLLILFLSYFHFHELAMIFMRRFLLYVEFSLYSDGLDIE